MNEALADYNDGWATDGEEVVSIVPRDSPDSIEVLPLGHDVSTVHRPCVLWPHVWKSWLQQCHTRYAVILIDALATARVE